MRTKTLLLSAAVGAAGLLAANAQVYSVNSVGYINLTIPPGFSMIANQLKTPNNTISALFPAPPLGTQILAWTGTGYSSYSYVDPIGLGASWLPNGDLALNPGQGVFIRNPSATALTVTLVGEVPQMADSNISLPAGFSIASSTVPMSGNLVAAAPAGMGMPHALGDQVLKWTGSAYSSFSYADPLGLGPSWLPSQPSVVVGEAFFVRKQAAANWTRNFNVNQ